jgi:hypothetical protein
MNRLNARVPAFLRRGAARSNPSKKRQNNEKDQNGADHPEAAEQGEDQEDDEESGEAHENANRAASRSDAAMAWIIEPADAKIALAATSLAAGRFGVEWLYLTIAK